MLDKHPCERILRDDMIGESGTERRTIPTVRELTQRFRRFWERLVFFWRWIRMPNQVGEPITLEPRKVRVLLILILGNLVVLALLGTALRQAIAMSAAERPTPRELVVAPVPQASPRPSPTPDPTPTPLGSGGAMVFSLRRDGNTDIYALDQRTEQLVRLTHHQAEDRSPTWSPDGNYVAFASNRAHNWDIYLLDLVSGALIRLTHDASFDANPSWSPDGQWIAFESYRQGNLDVYVMSTAGKQLHPITTDPGPDYAPAWAPDSEAVVFTSLREGNKDLYLRHLGDELEAANLTQTRDLDEDAPAWSPDSTRLAYICGPEGDASVQVAAFREASLSVSQTQSEFFGSGHGPTWAPDGQSLVYAWERDGWSHLVTTSMTGWALFHEVYGTEGFLDDLAWSDVPLSPRIIARAQDTAPDAQEDSHVEGGQPASGEGAPPELVSLPGVSTEEGSPFLSAQVSDSFNALRRRVAEEAGWDYLGELDSALVSLDYVPPASQSRKSWHLCGRAFSVDQEPYEGGEPMIELVREEIGNDTYWRVFVRTAAQDGSLGEPLRETPWDLNARWEGGPAEVEGGAPKAQLPSGYYVDLTALARDYGWERVPSRSRWRQFWPDIRWWEFRQTGDLTWWDCMLEVFEPEEVESAFGPIPGREE